MLKFAVEDEVVCGGSTFETNLIYTTRRNNNTTAIPKIQASILKSFLSISDLFDEVFQPYYLRTRCNGADCYAKNTMHIDILTC